MRNFLLLSLFLGSPLMASDNSVNKTPALNQLASNDIVWTPQAPLRSRATATREYWENRAITDPLVKIRGNTVWVGKRISKTDVQQDDLITNY
ncbi:hypothetical protein IM40_11395 (plasmid) [Candidatus Paracaedimonas acanthamoebae]|nr:hypothetical protein IM40_11395 [Candidatus Paracaedimonas acanthamoebae]